jgi:hypothetical protein
MTTYNYAEIGGHKMFYREAGDDSAPPIVLLYVLPTSSLKMASGQHQENPCQNQLRS